MRGLSAPVLAIILILLLFAGVYWGVVVKPAQDAFWAKVDAVTVVHGATSTDKGSTRKIDGPTATEVFQKIQKAPTYSPNHPTTVRVRKVDFSTDQGLISLEIRETKDQGCLAGDLPVRRVEDIAGQVFR